MFFLKLFKKKIFYLVLLVVAVAGAGLYYSGYGRILFYTLFGGKEYKIANTKVIVKNVRRISQLFTQEYYNEHVKTVVIQNEIKLVIIAKGRVRAGIDFQEVSESDITVDGKTISMKLPEVKVIETIINPSDFEIFDQSKKFSHRQVSRYKKEARQELTQKALERGILEKSKKQTIAVLENFFKSLGFFEVNLHFPPEPSA